MGLFFKKKDESKKGISPYMEDQQSVFNTEGEKKETTREENYDQYIMRKKDYSNVPKYKAFDEKNVEVVVDKEQIGYQKLNDDVQTVDIEKENLYADLQELVANAPVLEDSDRGHKSIDEALKSEISNNNEVDVIDVVNEETVIADISEENIKQDEKLSIFGNSDEPIQAKVYEVKQAPIPEKIEIIDVEFKTEEPKTEIRFNERGEKICPKCGAPLDPSAPTCFLCGNKF